VDADGFHVAVACTLDSLEVQTGRARIVLQLKNELGRLIRDRARQPVLGQESVDHDVDFQLTLTHNASPMRSARSFSSPEQTKILQPTKRGTRAGSTTSPTLFVGQASSSVPAMVPSGLKTSKSGSGTGNAPCRRRAI